MPALRELVVSRLKDAGVRMIFGVPGGGGNLDLIEAAGQADLPFVLSATETGGALAALAQAEVTGRPGACLTTLGPGAASVANGVACALLDRVPLLVFTDSHAAAAHGAFEHQQFDHRALFRPITKWSGRLSAECVDRTLDQAFASLLDPPPGPVHIDWPADFETTPGRSSPESQAPSPEPRVPSPESRAPSPESRASSPDRFAALISRSRRPLFIVGLGARQPADVTAIRGLLERHGAPAMVTYKAKGVVPDRHPCFAGVFTHALIEQAVVGTSDLIVGVGLDPVELLPRPWSYSQPAVYVGRWQVPCRHVPFAAQFVTDTPAGIREIDALLQTPEWDLEIVCKKVNEQRRAIDISAEGMTAQDVVRVAADQLAGAARVTVDAGAHMLPATLLWPVDAPGQMLISNGLSTMGFALPAAIGAALADRSRPVVALTGDGGLLMCAAELLTAVREKLRIIVIVFSDQSLSLIEIKQQRRQYHPAGVALGAVNWPALGESLGAASFIAANEADLARALETARECQGPCLIEAKIDKSNYSRTLEVVRG
ncbi:MAG TPA: thiamine pyrophosphate-binding protein [Vicinamibacterales bacterium]|nr:thiamine pyrophosphate-binding protein [Vicinamibacterales bacterium]